MADPVQPFDIPTQPTLIECFRAFRSYLEKVAESQGKTLAPEWYEDGPEQRPRLYQDQPEVLAALKKRDAETDAHGFREM